MDLEILVNSRLEPLLATRCRCGWVQIHEVDRLSAGEWLPCYCGATVEVDVRTLIEARALSVRLKEVCRS
jgi:hypothetical protein